MRRTVRQAVPIGAAVAALLVITGPAAVMPPPHAEAQVNTHMKWRWYHAVGKAAETKTRRIESIAGLRGNHPFAERGRFMVEFFSGKCEVWEVRRERTTFTARRVFRDCSALGFLP